MRGVFWEVSPNADSDGPSVVVVMRRATAAGGWVGWFGLVGLVWFDVRYHRPEDDGWMDGMGNHLVVVVVVVECHPPYHNRTTITK